LDRQIVFRRFPSPLSLLTPRRSEAGSALLDAVHNRSFLFTEITTLLGGAFPPVLSTFLTKGVYVMNKLGWADLGRGEKGALIQDIVKNGKSYVVAWQNLEMHEDATRTKDKNGNVLYNQVDIAAVVEKTVTAYEA
jgi:hypothetical protein